MFYPTFVVVVLVADGSKTRDLEVRAANKFRAEDFAGTKLAQGETIVKTVRKHPKQKGA